MAEQLRNVSAMDDVCALHHISTSSLLALGYIVMYKYIYILCMYIHDYACIYNYIYIHNHVYIQLCIDEYYLYSTKSNERG